LRESKEVAIFTRGVSSQTGAGGFAVIILYKDCRKELVGGCPAASNNRMDIRAAVEGLKALRQPCHVKLYNNNAYLIDSMAKGWVLNWRARGWTNSEKRPTPHVDLWEELLGLCSVHEVSFVYRRLDCQHNELVQCDRLAHEAATREKWTEGNIEVR
jgi:ribonuclease HI